MAITPIYHHLDDVIDLYMKRGGGERIVLRKKFIRRCTPRTIQMFLMKRMKKVVRRAIWIRKTRMVLKIVCKNKLGFIYYSKYLK